VRCTLIAIPLRIHHNHWPRGGDEPGNQQHDGGVRVLRVGRLPSGVGTGLPNGIPARTARDSDQWRIEAATNRGELARLTPHWHQLVQRSDSASAFNTSAAVLTWYRHVERHSDVYVVTVWRADQLVGIAPFSVIRLGFYRLFVSAGAGYGYHGDPLLGSEPETVAAVIADHLSRLVSSGTAAVYLRRLRSDGVMSDIVAQRADLACRQLGSEEVSSLVRFDQMPDPEQYFLRIARKRAIGRRSRRLAERFDRVQYVAEDPDPDVALHTMRDMLQRRFGTDLRIFRSAPNRALTHDLVHELLAAGHAQVSSMFADGRRITVTVKLHVGPRIFWYAVAYEPELSEFSLGHLELFETLQRAHASGAIEIDLGSAGFSYKQNWANADSHHRTVVVTAPGRRGEIANNLRRAAIRIHRARRVENANGVGPHVV
jgi:CelD/BcsL family acetyltransferase involved in cellulose biosynthesis